MTIEWLGYIIIFIVGMNTGVLTMCLFNIPKQDSNE